MSREPFRVSEELIERNCEAIGEQLKKAAEGAAQGFRNFADACAKIDWSHDDEHRSHD